MKNRLHGMDEGTVCYGLRLKIASLARGESEGFECKLKDRNQVRRVAEELRFPVTIEQMHRGSMIARVRARSW